MPYIGKGGNNGFGIRERYRYSASGGQTDFTSTDLDSKTLQIDSGSLVDVYLNGVLLDTADYNTNTVNQVTLTSGATASDEVMIVVYDVFSLSDAMPKTGGTFSGAVTHTGAFTSPGIDDNADATTITLDANEDITASNGMYVSGDLTSLTVDKGGIDRSGNTTRIISGRSGGNYADFSVNIAGVGGVNRQVYVDYQGNMTLDNGNLTIGTNGKGIDFSATGDGTSVSNESELFADYEKGNFTATLKGTSGSIGSGAGLSATFTYIKVGNLVHINGSINPSNMGSFSGDAIITGLPFTGGGNHGFGIGISTHDLDSRSTASANYHVKQQAGTAQLNFGKPNTDAVPYSEVGDGHMGIGGAYPDFS